MLYLQFNNSRMLPRGEVLRTFDYILVVTPPDSHFVYNDHAYNVVWRLLERLSGLKAGAL